MFVYCKKNGEVNIVEIKYILPLFILFYIIALLAGHVEDLISTCVMYCAVSRQDKAVGGIAPPFLLLCQPLRLRCPPYVIVCVTWPTQAQFVALLLATEHRGRQFVTRSKITQLPWSLLKSSYRSLHSREMTSDNKFDLRGPPIRSPKSPFRPINENERFFQLDMTDVEANRTMIPSKFKT